MIDPCKGMKCLKYPLCIQHKTIHCRKFQEYVHYYIMEVLKFTHPDRALYVSPNCRKRIWNHIDTIYPKMKTLIMFSLNEDHKEMYMYQIERPHIKQHADRPNLYHNI